MDYPLLVSSPSEFDFARYPVPVLFFDQLEEIAVADTAGPFIGSYRRDTPVELLFYANLPRGETLYVSLHGATRRGRDTYPRFDRIGSLGKTGVPFVAFADPGLVVDKNMELSWYLGGRDWDPLTDMVKILRSAMLACKATKVCVIGGSGGGFAALRLAHEMPESLAFVFNPQICIPSYIPKVRDYYFASMHGASTDEVLSSRPDYDFDLASLYQTFPSTNRVYYLQNLTDGSHVRFHYKPFKDAMGILGTDGSNEAGTIKLVLFDSERAGHQPPSAEEFKEHLNLAVTWGLK